MISPTPTPPVKGCYYQKTACPQYCVVGKPCPTCTPKLVCPTPTPKIQAPGNLSLKISGTTIYAKGQIGENLVWTKSTNAIKYNVYQRTSETQGWGAALVGTAALRYTAIVSATQPHYFVVEACNTYSCVKSNEVFIKPQGSGLITFPPQK